MTSPVSCTTESIATWPTWATPPHSASDFVAGIFPRPSGITDPDVVFALNDRADAIEERARELATIAIERGDAWVQEFGDPPENLELYEQWVLEVAAGAAYFDRWSIDEPDSIFDDALVSRDQETQRSRVFGATQRARALTVVEDAHTVPTYALSGAEVLEPPSQDFGIDL